MPSGRLRWLHPADTAKSGWREPTVHTEKTIAVPTGISATNSSIGRWFKRVGEPVTIAEPLVEVESDNTTVEVLASATGVLSKILLRDGQSVVGSTTLGSITEFEDGMAATRKTTRRANHSS